MVLIGLIQLRHALRRISQWRQGLVQKAEFIGRHELVVLIESVQTCLREEMTSRRSFKDRVPSIYLLTRTEVKIGPGFFIRD
jgi:hypothetical protein